MTQYACANCGKLNEYQNYCDWACHVELAKKEGGKIITPNGLPIRCIRHDGTMLEHEHGDHKDYKFPVLIENTDADSIKENFVQREIDETAPVEWIEDAALIYCDGSVALTLYECTYSIWSVHDGECLGGYHTRHGVWKLTNESLEKIRTYSRTKD